MYLCMYVCMYIKVVQNFFLNYSCLTILICNINNKNNMSKILLN